MNKVITVILAVMLIIVSSCIKSEDNHGNEDSNYIALCGRIVVVVP